jgi:hypothetical protein
MMRGRDDVDSLISELGEYSLGFNNSTSKQTKSGLQINSPSHNQQHQQTTTIYNNTTRRKSSSLGGDDIWLSSTVTTDAIARRNESRKPSIDLSDLEDIMSSIHSPNNNKSVSTVLERKSSFKGMRGYSTSAPNLSYLDSPQNKNQSMSKCPVQQLASSKLSRGRFTYAQNRFVY